MQHAVCSVQCVASTSRWTKRPPPSAGMQVGTNLGEKFGCIWEVKTGHPQRRGSRAAVSGAGQPRDPRTSTMRGVSSRNGSPPRRRTVRTGKNFHGYHEVKKNKPQACTDSMTLQFEERMCVFAGNCLSVCPCVCVTVQMCVCRHACVSLLHMCWCL